MDQMDHINSIKYKVEAKVMKYLQLQLISDNARTWCVEYDIECAGCKTKFIVTQQVSYNYLNVCKYWSNCLVSEIIICYN